VVADGAKSVALAPEIAGEETVMAAPLLFVTVTLFTALGLPIPSLPKASVAAERVTCCTPVPVRATVCGLLVALSVMFNVAVMGPVAVGVNFTLIVHEAWPAREVLQVVAETANALALGPEMAFPERVMAVLSLFVSVTVLAALVLLRP